MGFLASLALKLFTGPVLGFVSSVVGKLADEHVAVVQAQTGLSIAEVNGVIGAEQTRINAQASITLASMTHPVWWIGWVLFVIPAGAYDALIHLKSLACPFYETACTWNILRVPATIESWDQYVVLSFFGLAATSSVVSSIASKINTPK